MATANSLAEKQVAESQQRAEERRVHAPSGIAVFATVFQIVMIAAHWFVYETWSVFWGPMETITQRTLAVSVAVLSFSFLGTTLLAFRYNNFLLRTVYRAAAVWLGALSFLFLAAIASWAVYGFVLAGAFAVPSRWIGVAMFGLAAVVSAWGVVNANWVRVKKISVRLENLPEAWRGRTAVLASDLHLGHVHHRGFSKRIVRKIAGLRPDVVFIAGDLFDGTFVDAAEVTEPWKKLRASFGTYFVNGNHELFGGKSVFLDAVRSAGIRVLQNEKVNLDGLQIAGVPYEHATHAEHFRSVLAKLAIDPAKTSVLLTHAPDRPGITEEAGIGLQLSGHTHLGQFFPFTWITKRIYGQFTYGLSRLGATQFYTSSGAGSWGPPLRIGSQSEIVQITFE
ncbi:MAG TPA: metallophosphoesterase [Candidatus Dormibacteraeota bacterium]|jgi:predicted MPP superfamily phosphohydrolase|nr:metallophosphoesterase [Candidatus Dormibacteraeota bacterium]